MAYLPESLSSGHTVRASLWLGGLAVACIAVLGLVSGMSLYCFTKAIGISFLGRSRSSAATGATEGTEYMLAKPGVSRPLLYISRSSGARGTFSYPACLPPPVWQSSVNVTSFTPFPWHPFA